eukprot:g32780.t1
MLGCLMTVSRFTSLTQSCRGETVSFGLPKALQVKWCVRLRELGCRSASTGAGEHGGTVPDTAPTSVTSATTSATVARPTSKTWSFLRHVLERLLGLYILLGAVGVPLWAFASHRFDKRRTLAQATLLQGLALLVVFLFVEQGAVPIYSTCIVLAGLSFGGVPVLRFSMLADVADLAQLRSGGKRDEGKLVALFGGLVPLLSLNRSVGLFGTPIQQESHYERRRRERRKRRHGRGDERDEKPHDSWPELTEDALPREMAAREAELRVLRKELEARNQEMFHLEDQIKDTEAKLAAKSGEAGAISAKVGATTEKHQALLEAEAKHIDTQVSSLKERLSRVQKELFEKDEDLKILHEQVAHGTSAVKAKEREHQALLEQHKEQDEEVAKLQENSRKLQRHMSMDHWRHQVEAQVEQEQHDAAMVRQRRENQRQIEVFHEEMGTLQSYVLRMEEKRKYHEEEIARRKEHLKALVVEERLCVAAARMGQHTAEELKKGRSACETESRNMEEQRALQAKLQEEMGRQGALAHEAKMLGEGGNWGRRKTQRFNEEAKKSQEALKALTACVRETAKVMKEHGPIDLGDVESALKKFLLEMRQRGEMVPPIVRLSSSSHLVANHLTIFCELSSAGQLCVRTRAGLVPMADFLRQHGYLKPGRSVGRKHAPKAHPAQALQAAPHGAHAAHGKGGHGQFGVHGAMAKGKGSPKRLGTSFHRFGAMGGSSSKVKTGSAHRERIVLFGDSLTQQSFAPNGWGAALADAYQRRGDVLNRGYSGYNTRWCLEMLKHGGGIMQDAGPDDTTRLVTIFLGANDASLLEENPKQHVPIEEYKSNLRQIVAIARERAPSAKILMICPPPVCHSQRLEWQKARFKDEATGRLERTNDSWPEYLSDGLHFSERGNIFVGKKLLEKILEVLPELAVVPCKYTGQYGNSGSSCSGIVTDSPWWEDIDPECPEKSFKAPALSCELDGLSFVLEVACPGVIFKTDDMLQQFQQPHYATLYQFTTPAMSSTGPASSPCVRRDKSVTVTSDTFSFVLELRQEELKTGHERFKGRL